MYVKEIDSRTCVFCHSPADTRDHIPGKQFFPDPKPQNLATVPCCESCNEGHKKNEDYFRALFCFGPAGISDAGRRLWDQKLRRTYEKDLGLRKIIAKSMREINPMTPSGLILPPRLAVEIDWSRVLKVVEKWVRGFYYFEYGQALSPSIFVEIAPVHHGNRESLADSASQLAVGKADWKEVFLYKCNRVPELPECSVWLFYVYQNHEFFAVTYPPEDIEGTSRQRFEADR